MLSNVPAAGDPTHTKNSPPITPPTERQNGNQARRADKTIVGLSSLVGKHVPGHARPGETIPASKLFCAVTGKPQVHSLWGWNMRY